MAVAAAAQVQAVAVAETHDQLVPPDQPGHPVQETPTLDEVVTLVEVTTRHDEVDVAQVHQTIMTMTTILWIVNQIPMTVAVPGVVDTYEEHSTLLDMVRRIHQRLRIATRSLRTPIQRPRIRIQRVRIAMDLVHQIMMMMIVKMMMIHPVLVDHLVQVDQTIVADLVGHPVRTIVAGHLVQVEVLRVQVEVLRAQESPR